MSVDPASVSEVMPLELLDKATGSAVLVLLKSNQEYQGTLVGFDQFTNLILENVTEPSLTKMAALQKSVIRRCC
ncbi:hypothetical protein P9112_011653 [Eukaryota sp. TZLM1-RC]